MTRGAFPRDVLNRLRWEERKSLQDAEVVILHRGAPNDRQTIPGRDIKSIGHMFFDTEDSPIPFHRVLEIWYHGRKIFDKNEISRIKRRMRKGLTDNQR